jgi:hypothetical protein
MKVLIDRHHAGLFYSLQLLGDRLGWDVYTPVGFEWWDEDYWTFGRDAYGDARLRDQYLDVEDAAWSRWRQAGTPWAFGADGLWRQRDRDYPDRDIIGVTLPQARTMHWDYVMATVQDNQHGFARFAREQGARYAYQVGNTNQEVDWSLDPIALVSSEVPILGRGVRYHQEMHPAYHWVDPKGSTKRIASFVNYATHTECWPTTVALSGLLRDHEWSLYGAGMPDGSLQPTTSVAHAMAGSDWALHDKPTGDGFGHVLWGWAAIGRPLIGHASHYAGKLGGVLWRDLETCIDLDRHSIEEAAEIIRGITPLRHLVMCKAIHAAYRQHYSPARDAAAIARLLGA